MKINGFWMSRDYSTVSRDARQHLIWRINYLGLHYVRLIYTETYFMRRLGLNAFSVVWTETIAGYKL